MEAILKCRQCSKKKQDLLFDQLNPPKLLVWWKTVLFICKKALYSVNIKKLYSSKSLYTQTIGKFDYIMNQLMLMK